MREYRQIFAFKKEATQQMDLLWATLLFQREVRQELFPQYFTIN